MGFSHDTLHSVTAGHLFRGHTKDTSPHTAVTIQYKELSLGWSGLHTLSATAAHHSNQQMNISQPNYWVYRFWEGIAVVSWIHPMGSFFAAMCWITTYFKFAMKTKTESYLKKRLALAPLCPFCVCQSSYWRMKTKPQSHSLSLSQRQFQRHWFSKDVWLYKRYPFFTCAYNFNFLYQLLSAIYWSC